MRIGIKLVLGVAMVGLMVSATAHADTITTFTNRAAFDAAAGPTSVETFNSFVSEVPFHTVPLDVGDFTLSMNGRPSTSRNYMDIPPPQFGVFGIDGTTNANILTQVGSSLFLTFDTAITAFGADFAAFNDGVLRTRIIVGSNVITPPVQSGDVNSFFGFTSDTAFTTVEFRGVQNDGFSMDNVASAPVPEPGSLALMGLGGIGLLWFRRKRKSA